MTPVGEPPRTLGPVPFMSHSKTAWLGSNFHPGGYEWGHVAGDGLARLEREPSPLRFESNVSKVGLEVQGTWPRR